MPPRPTRRRSDSNAGPAITDERAAAAAVPLQTPAPTAERPKPRKFTALLDADTDARYGRMLDELRRQAGAVATREDGSGRVRTGYDLSRADLLRALLQVAEDDPSVMTEVRAKIEAHYRRSDTAT